MKKILDPYYEIKKLKSQLARAKFHNKLYREEIILLRDRLQIELKKHARNNISHSNNDFRDGLEVYGDRK